MSHSDKPRHKSGRLILNARFIQGTAIVGDYYGNRTHECAVDLKQVIGLRDHSQGWRKAADEQGLGPGIIVYFVLPNGGGMRMHIAELSSFEDLVVQWTKLVRD